MRVSITLHWSIGLFLTGASQTKESFCFCFGLCFCLDTWTLFIEQAISATYGWIIWLICVPLQVDASSLSELVFSEFPAFILDSKMQKNELISKGPWPWSTNKLLHPASLHKTTLLSRDIAGGTDLLFQFFHLKYGNFTFNVIKNWFYLFIL